MKINSEYGKILLRITISLVFLWFGINQILSPSDWVDFVPAFASVIVNAKTLVLVNGVFEIIFGLMLLTGIYVRISALLLGLHLMGIATSLGYGALMIRDLGLSFATLSISLLGPDKWCWGYKKSRE